MTKEQLAPWIEKLTKANPKDRTAIVGEMCKENGLKVGDAWRLLKEAGFDSKATPPSNNTPQGDNQQGGAAPDRKPAKRRVRQEHLKGKNLIVGNKTIAFDADGIAELDAADAERLLTIPGYTEVSDA
ncbi:MAG: hypothetical protein LBK73_08835 [Treponema sp.]|jgi:hypothetical protein|nr:hypothetical protein [Treponema sp.]